ncbi:MAG: CotH kinase family protein [Clostridiales Family XIII bacterium]|jgi:hypothetical protein|nr:CotH kinase family protein [Clostridiales Family XIII bacterium]
MKSIVESPRRRTRVKNLRACLCAGVALVVLFSAVALPTLFSAVFAPPERTDAGYMQHRDAMQPLRTEEQAAVFASDAGGVLTSFSSHLPLVLIDTGGRAVPIHQRMDDEKGYMLPIPGVEPFVPCGLYIYDSGGYNSLADAPTALTRAKIKRRGNTSHSFEKAHYKLKLLAADGAAENQLPLLGMEAEDEWVLNGCMLDKSLLRNYLAFTVAAEVLPYTPDVRYCEVLVRDDKGLHYDGVYLLMENIKQGKGRVELSEEPPHGGVHSYLLRRDRYDPDRPMLRTYATEKGLSAGYLGLLYPKNDKLDDAVLRYVEADISAAEKVLYAEDVSVFLTYPDYIDVDSFVDYFVLNEFFGNYDAGWNSTYFYKDLGGKLCAGPVWDYDGIMDNYIPAPMDPEAVPFAGAPWFDRLILDKAFVERVLTRYAELRRGPLSQSRIDAMLHETARYLGPAQQRDWQRWQDIYTGSAYALQDAVVPVSSSGGAQASEPARLRRQTDSYEQEVLKLRHLLHVHGASIPIALPKMDLPRAGIISATDDYKKNSALMTLFLLAFASAAWIARRHGDT